jgi:glutamate dehydrogenase/leucine dehydrogenase
MMAASDSKGAIMSKTPMDADKLIAYKEKTSSVVGFPGSQPTSDKELLQMDVDILSPSALENAILPDIAKGIKAKIIAECANGPTTPEADKILRANKVFVIPDILANSGGVIVSYLEWVQNLERIMWTEKEVNGMLEQKITSAFNDVHAASLKHDTDMRTAAMIVGVGRVAEAVKTLGTFP